MSDDRPGNQNFDLTDEPVRRGSSDNNIGLDSKGNFHRAVEVTTDIKARKNARRGK